MTNVVGAFSIAEMISAFPSAGGLVGFARISLRRCGVYDRVSLLYLRLSATFGAVLWGNYIYYG